MPDLSNDEAWRFLRLLARISEDMNEAMSDIDRLPDDEYRQKWGAPPSQVAIEVGRDNYRQFAKHAYFDKFLGLTDDEIEDEREGARSLRFDDESTSADAGESLFEDMDESLSEN